MMAHPQLAPPWDSCGRTGKRLELRKPLTEMHGRDGVRVSVLRAGNGAESEVGMW